MQPIPSPYRWVFPSRLLRDTLLAEGDHPGIPFAQGLLQRWNIRYSTYDLNIPASGDRKSVV